MRLLSTLRHAQPSFYLNKHLEFYASRPARRLTLRQLLFFGRSIDEAKVIKSGEFVRSELPVRLAHRIRDFQSLPFGVMREESMKKVYEIYCEAFEVRVHRCG